MKYLLCVNLLVSYLCSAQYFTKTNNFNKFNTLYKWKQISYNFNGVKYKEDTKQQRSPGELFFEEDVEENEIFFKQYNNVPVGLDVYHDRVFVTIPRRRFGIPSTLNVLEADTESPLLMPYPDVASVSRLVSVYRPRVDLCDRLWLVDTGLLEIPNNRVQVKRPEIIIYDLKSNSEIMRHQLKSSAIVNDTTSGLTSITVDVSKSRCDDAYAYINDLATPGIIVFSLRERDSWRFSHKSFLYDNGAMYFKSGNQWIDWTDGLFSIALSKADSQGVRKAYYHPFISTQEFSIRTDVLQNKSSDFDKNYKLEGVRGVWSQSGSHAYHEGTSTLLFANIAQDGVMCWDTSKPLTSKITALVAQHHEKLVYISDLKVVGDEVWVLVNQMPRFVYSKLNVTQYNFTIMKANVTELIKNTACE